MQGPRVGCRPPVRNRSQVGGTPSPPASTVPQTLPLAGAGRPSMLAPVPAFVCESLQRIRDLGISVERYTLPGGMLHLHLACADPHRACAVGFRSPPEDDSGAPHILEHTVLCGSRRFPVRDPFFAMLRRSQATYLNAIT